MKPRRAIAAAATVCVIASASCSARHDMERSSTSSGSTSTASSVASLSAAPIPASAKVPFSRANPRERAAIWLRAAGEDEAERMRLTEAVGASELVDALADGGETERVALASMPFAPDAELALLPLSTRARAATSPEARRAIFDAALAIAGGPRDQRDPIDPEGTRLAAHAFVAIANDAKLSREERSAAVSIARALARKGFLPEAAVPTSLDPE